MAKFWQQIVDFFKGLYQLTIGLLFKSKVGDLSVIQLIIIIVIILVIYHLIKNFVPKFFKTCVYGAKTFYFDMRKLIFKKEKKIYVCNQCVTEVHECNCNNLSVRKKIKKIKLENKLKKD